MFMKLNQWKALQLWISLHSSIGQYLFGFDVQCYPQNEPTIFVWRIWIYEDA